MGVRPVENGLSHHLSKVEWKQEQTWLDEGKEEKVRHRASKTTPIRDRGRKPDKQRWEQGRSEQGWLKMESVHVLQNPTMQEEMWGSEAADGTLEHHSVALEVLVFMGPGYAQLQAYPDTHY